MESRDWQAETALLQERDRKARRVLGVEPDDDAQAIRRAFRQASLAHHPDVNGQEDQAARRFHLICCAYKFLTEGLASDDLDNVGAPPATPDDTPYDLTNAWGYWCWWRERYF